MSNWLQIYNYFSRNCTIRVLKQIKAPTEVMKTSPPPITTKQT